MRAVKNFKRIMDPGKAESVLQSILGNEHDAHFVTPPMEMDDNDEFPAVGLSPRADHDRLALAEKIKDDIQKRPILAGPQGGRQLSADAPASNLLNTVSSAERIDLSGQQPDHSIDTPERKASGSIRRGRLAGREETPGAHSQSASPRPELSRPSSATTKRSVEGTRGHARDPLEEEFPYLFIGPSTYSGTSPQEPSKFNIGSDTVPISARLDDVDEGLDPALQAAESEEPVPIVSESPGAAEFDIYETAYRKELERIRSNTSILPDAGVSPKVYLTRRVEGKHEVMEFIKDKVIDLQMGSRKALASGGRSASAFGAAVSLLRNQIEQKKEAERRADQPASPRERRPSHPPSSSLTAQSIPGPEASSLEAKGVPATDSSTEPESAPTQLRRLLDRVREKTLE